MTISKRAYWWIDKKLWTGWRTFNRLLPIEPSESAFEALLANLPAPMNVTQRKIIFVCGSLGPGGSERQLVYTIEGLKRFGFRNIELLCVRLNENHPGKYDFHLQRVREAGVEPREVGSRPIGMCLPRTLAENFHGIPPGVASDIANLYFEFRQMRPQIVHAWIDWNNVRAGYAAALAGVPRVVISGRNLNPSHFVTFEHYMRSAYRVLLRKTSTQFINNSEAGAKDYSRWLNCDPSRIKIINNAIEYTENTKNGYIKADQIKSLGIPRNSFLVGSVFRLYPEKRPILWVDAAAEVIKQQKNTYFVLYGQGIMESQIRTRIMQHNLQDKILLPGLTNQPLDAIRTMDLFLLTSSVEGLPNVLLEAQWVGTAIVAMDAGGVRETFKEGVTGWLIKKPDPKCIANTIVWLLQNERLRKEAGRYGKKFVKNRFSLSKMINSLTDVYGT